MINSTWEHVGKINPGPISDLELAQYAEMWIYAAGYITEAGDLDDLGGIVGCNMSGEWSDRVAGGLPGIFFDSLRYPSEISC